MALAPSAYVIVVGAGLAGLIAAGCVQVSETGPDCPCCTELDPSGKAESFQVRSQPNRGQSPASLAQVSRERPRLVGGLVVLRGLAWANGFVQSRGVRGPGRQRRWRR